ALASSLSRPLQRNLFHEHELRFSRLRFQSAKSGAQGCAQDLGRAASAALERPDPLRRIVLGGGHGLARSLGARKYGELLDPARSATAFDSCWPPHHDPNDEAG